jgi:hypothetical protein
MSRAIFTHSRGVMFDESSSGAYSWIVNDGIDGFRNSGISAICFWRYPGFGRYPARVRCIPMVPPV